ncbi:MAG: ABC transporter transmembrane domain-containing protein [Caldilineaceae bacterium]|nr:ABC transporter transmembrane domain-containing protein [Caldilineaceae bacterium]
MAEQLPSFRVTASFRADIGWDERFADHWVLAGTTGLALVGGDTIELLPWPELGTVACHRYVGSGSLTTGHGADTRLLAHFSAARMADAQNFARAANQIRTGVSSATFDDRPETPRNAQPSDNQPDFDGPPSGNILSRLFQLMPDSKWWRLPIVALALAGGGIAAVASPYLAGQFLFDEVLAPQGLHTGRLGLAIGLILLARLAEMALRTAWGWTNASLIHDLEIRLKRTAFAAIQHLPMRFFSDRHTGELMTRLEQDASDIALLFHIILPSAIHGGVFLAGSLIAMVALDWQLALAVLLPFPILFMVFRRVFPEVDSLYERMFRAEADLRSVTSDSLTGMRVVRAFGRQRREMNRFAQPNRTAARLGFRADAHDRIHLAAHGVGYGTGPGRRLDRRCLDDCARTGNAGAPHHLRRIPGPVLPPGGRTRGHDSGLGPGVHRSPSAAPTHRFGVLRAPIPRRGSRDPVAGTHHSGTGGLRL